MSRKRLGLKLEQMRKRHLQELGAGRGGVSGRRKPGRWWRASWQRSRKRWQAGLNRTKKWALERDFRVVLSWLRQLERRVPRWRGRWFRDARRPGVDAHEPPHVRKKKRAGGTRSRAWLVPVTHFYLRTVTCLDWKARSSCYSWVVFFSLSSLQITAFRHHLWSSAFGASVLSVTPKKLCLGIVSKHVLPLPGSTTSSPTDPLTGRQQNRWTWGWTHRLNVDSCWETPLDHMNHEGEGVLYVLENCRWGQTGNAFQREKCKVGSLFLKTCFASLLRLWSMLHPATQEFRKGVTDWFLRSSTAFFKYYAVVSFGEKKILSILLRWKFNMVEDLNVNFK